MQELALEQGFASESDLRAAFERLVASPLRGVAEHGTVSLAWLESPIGPLVAASTSDAVCLLEFAERDALESQIAAVRSCFRCALTVGRTPVIERLERELEEYFAGKRRRFEVPLAYPGTPFQERVWSALLEIPYGETWSYRELARRIGDERAIRAVGRANGQNRIAIVIPCHRVVNADGGLGGYGGGLWRKRFLLDLERGDALPLAH
ncbi:MAG: methylated-DNA--[protein]-cysteine S-methyltransferase [Pseudomonadota bacterium]|jgi:O-6-methylguanine DNA methyltransferase